MKKSKAKPQTAGEKLEAPVQLTPSNSKPSQPVSRRK